MRCYLHENAACNCHEITRPVNKFYKVRNVTLLVVDVESTCWNSRSGEKPPGRSDGSGKLEKTEIIEIGICELCVKTGKRLSKESIIIRPEVSSISKFCENLTGHTQEEVNKGISFAEACKILLTKYNSRGRPWASYGMYDLNMFKMQCVPRVGPAYPFSDRHINVKTIAALSKKATLETGMAKCLDRYNLPLTGKHHNGADDAWNIAAILGTAMCFNKSDGNIIHEYKE